jgi:hypothetical protein
MSFLQPNGKHLVQARQRGLKIWAGAVTLVNGADPTALSGEGFRVARTGEGVYTVTLDEAVPSAFLFGMATLDTLTGLQFCGMRTPAAGDATNGASVIIDTGTLSIDNAFTADDRPAAIMRFVLIGLSTDPS